FSFPHSMHFLAWINGHISIVTHLDWLIYNCTSLFVMTCLSTFSTSHLHPSSV
ncbi:hypothetical protein MPH_14209, partial [Macrophomina phaseolina MS6]